MLAADTSAHRLASLRGRAVKWWVMQFVLEYAPIILFFAAYKISGIFVATAIAIGASLLSIGYAFFVLKKVTTIQWLSLAIIVVFGGATLLLHDETFIKWKPSALYLSFAIALFVGKVFMKRDWIRVLFEQASIKAPAVVWTRVTWAWIVFFLGMAALNGYVATYYSLDTWVNFKVWWAMGIFLAFTIGNVALLSKYIAEDAASATGDAVATPSNSSNASGAPK
jgi:intracellular septation protein